MDFIMNLSTVFILIFPNYLKMFTRTHKFKNILE